MSEEFEQFAILEIMGHQRFAGIVSEQALGGASFVRIDVPEVDGQPAFSKIFGAGSIYCITPCTEQVALAMVKSLRKSPMQIYDFPEEVRAKLRGPATVPADFDDDDIDVD